MHDPSPPQPVANLSLIAALADNGVIGRGNALPWHLPADLAHFKRLTIGKPIIMGRRTWESLPGLLPHRPHVVVTRDRAYQAEGAGVAHSLHDALVLAGDVDEVMVVGGAQLYAQALPLASRLYLTRVHAGVEGDAYFPPFDADDWIEVEREEREADARNPHAMTFLTLRRR